MKIGVVAPACRIEPETAERVQALAGGRAEIVFHPQCFESHGHFAGSDTSRLAAFVETANDPAVDAVWFARGGYGSCRFAEAALDRLGEAAHGKTYLGYSDGGTLLAGLYARGIGRPVHGPMPNDILREGGETAVTRSLAYLVDGDTAGLEPSLDRRPAAALNMTILSHLIGTDLEPDLGGHVLMLEEVSEHHYRIDRMMFHLTSARYVRQVAGIRLGRCTLIPDNEPAFGEDDEAIVRHWCEASGIAYLGRADIGHDADNKIVPFGRGERP